MKKITKFLAEYMDDLFILVGILLIVTATIICFGIGVSLYILGIFLIILGIIDVSRLRGR